MIVGDLTGPEPASEKPAEQRPGWDGFDTFQKAFSQIKQMHCSHSYWLLLLHLPKPQGFGRSEYPCAWTAFKKELRPLLLLHMFR
jgi:hypothetical protein